MGEKLCLPCEFLSCVTNKVQWISQKGQVDITVALIMSVN